jgi:hypothetical protein
MKIVKELKYFYHSRTDGSDNFKEIYSRHFKTFTDHKTKILYAQKVVQAESMCEFSTDVFCIVLYVVSW